MELFINVIDHHERPDILNLYQTHETYHEGDAGHDIFFPDNLVIPKKAIGHKIKLRISAQSFNSITDKYHSFYLYPRSSIYKSPIRLSNSVGIIDSGYTGELGALVDNLSDEPYEIKKGTRMFQLCFHDLSPMKFKLVNGLRDTARGSGGFGSTDAIEKK